MIRCETLSKDYRFVQYSVKAVFSDHFLYLEQYYSSIPSPFLIFSPYRLHFGVNLDFTERVAGHDFL